MSERETRGSSAVDAEEIVLVVCHYWYILTTITTTTTVVTMRLNTLKALGRTGLSLRSLTSALLLSTAMYVQLQKISAVPHYNDLDKEK